MKKQLLQNALSKLCLIAAILVFAHCQSAKKEQFALDTGNKVQKAIKSNDIHVYTVTLKKGEFINVLVYQLGIDLKLTAFTPSDEVLKEVDSPNGSLGPEMVPIEVSADGEYRIEVQSLEPNAPEGHYDISVMTYLSEADYKKRDIKLSPAQFNALSGNFEIEPGRIVTFGFSDDFGFSYLDTKTLIMGRLIALADTSFISPLTFFDESKIAVTVKFLKDSSNTVIGIEWTETGKEMLKGKPTKQFTSEEVTIQNGDVTLKGTLWLPVGSNKKAVAVYAHGSGDLTRYQGVFNTMFTVHGIGFLAFDKRGVGQSSGNWHTSSFQDLASDVVAAVKYLRTRPDIDTAHIGISGVSQGGWIGSIAAAMAPEVKFLMINTGSGVSVIENIAYENQCKMLEAMLPEDQVKEGTDFSFKIGQMAANGEAWEKIDEECAKVKGKAWTAFAFPYGVAKDNAWWQWFKYNGNIKSADYLVKVKCPVLWLLGANDHMVNSAVGEKNLREALDKSGAPYVLKTLPNARHGLLVGKEGSQHELMNNPLQLHPEYWSILTEWIPKYAMQADEVKK